MEPDDRHAWLHDWRGFGCLLVMTAWAGFALLALGYSLITGRPLVDRDGLRERADQSYEEQVANLMAD